MHGHAPGRRAGGAVNGRNWVRGRDETRDYEAEDSGAEWCLTADGSWGNCVCDPGGRPPPPPAGLPPPPPVELFFRGKYNIEGILGTLTNSDSLGDATDIVLGGCGGLPEWGCGALR